LLVFDVAVRIVRDPAEAEDVVQNVFLDVFRAMANFDSRKGIHRLSFSVDEIRGRKPLSASIFVADHLRPAAKKAGVHIEDGRRFGLHNLRHSLSNWQVNKAKIQPKTVQGLLRHSKIQTTLDLYTQEDSDETRAAQGEFLSAVGMSTTVN
jgi:integrase